MEYKINKDTPKSIKSNTNATLNFLTPEKKTKTNKNFTVLNDFSSFNNNNIYNTKGGKKEYTFYKNFINFSNISNISSEPKALNFNNNIIDNYDLKDKKLQQYDNKINEEKQINKEYKMHSINNSNINNNIMNKFIVNKSDDIKYTNNYDSNEDKKLNKNNFYKYINTNSNYEISNLIDFEESNLINKFKCNIYLEKGFSKNNYNNKTKITENKSIKINLQNFTSNNNANKFNLEEYVNESQPINSNLNDQNFLVNNNNNYNSNNINNNFIIPSYNNKIKNILNNLNNFYNNEQEPSAPSVNYNKHNLQNYLKNKGVILEEGISNIGLKELSNKDPNNYLENSKYLE